MPRSRDKKKNGAGATWRAITRFLHPRKDVTDKYPNVSNISKTENLIALRKEKKRVNKREQDCIVFWHPDFAEQDLYVVERYCRVINEGPCIELFGEDTSSIEDLEDNGTTVDVGLDTVEVLPNLTGDIREDIERLTLEGFEVDDDNEPDEENIPAPI